MIDIMLIYYCNSRDSWTPQKPEFTSGLPQETGIITSLSNSLSVREETDFQTFLLGNPTTKNIYLENGLSPTLNVGQHNISGNFFLNDKNKNQQ